MVDCITVEDEALLPDVTWSMPVSVLGGLHKEGNQSLAGHKNTKELHTLSVRMS